MVTVHGESGFRFIIFADDHEPAHVHVFGDGQAKINLAGIDGAPELVSAAEMKAGDLRKVMRDRYRAAGFPARTMEGLAWLN